MIRFDKEFHGAQMQLKYPRLMSNYLGCPPIEKCLLSYTQSKIDHHIHDQVCMVFPNELEIISDYWSKNCQISMEILKHSNPDN